MTIKAHCMGMEFPKRDTDSPNVKWELHRDVSAAACDWLSERSHRVPMSEDLPSAVVAEVTEYHDFVAMNLNEGVFDQTPEDCERILWESAVPTLGRSPILPASTSIASGMVWLQTASLPSAADLDAVAEEQRVKEKTS